MTLTRIFGRIAGNGLPGAGRTVICNPLLESAGGDGFLDEGADDKTDAIKNPILCKTQ